MASLDQPTRIFMQEAEVSQVGGMSDSVSNYEFQSVS